MRRFRTPRALHRGRTCRRPRASTKADDRQAIPLCPDHHQHGKHSLHKLGRRLFEGFWKLDLNALIRELNDWYEMEGKTA